MQEICNVFGITANINDMFSVVLLYDRYLYDSFFENHNDAELLTLLDKIDFGFDIQELGLGDKLSDQIQSMYSEIVAGGEVPEWFYQVTQLAIDNYENIQDATPDHALYLHAKDPKYNELAKRLLAFLNSSEHEATYNG